MKLYNSITLSIIAFIITCVQVLCAPLDVDTAYDISYNNVASILKITIATQEKFTEIWWNTVYQLFNDNQTSSFVARDVIIDRPELGTSAAPNSRESFIIFPPPLPPLPPIPPLPPVP